MNNELHAFLHLLCKTFLAPGPWNYSSVFPDNVDHRCFIIVYLTKMVWSESFSLFWLFLEQEEAEYTHFYERKVIFISTHKLKGWIEIGSFSTCTKRILEVKNFLSTLFSLHCCWKSGFWKKRSPYLYCSNYYDRIAWIFAFIKVSYCFLRFQGKKKPHHLHIFGAPKTSSSLND